MCSFTVQRNKEKKNVNWFLYKMAGILYKIRKHDRWYNKIEVLYNKIVVISVIVYFC